MVGDVKRLAVLALAVASLAACTRSPARAPSPSPIATHREYSIFMGAPSPDHEDLGFASYFPSTVTIHAGDSVELYNRGGFQAQHTVTFGIGAERPPLVTGGRLDPRVAVACAAPDDASPCTVSGSWTQLPPYGGHGFWSTGLVYDYERVEISTSPNLAPGEYVFGCLVHPGMRGVLRVVGPSTRADDPARVHAEALRRSDAAVAHATVPPTPSLAPAEVAAGWSSGDVLVNRFAPARLEIHPGDTVTWLVSSLQDVTFDSSVGVRQLSSGPLADGSVYRLRFDEPGVYRYHCTMHLGMTGVVVVRR